MIPQAVTDLRNTAIRLSHRVKMPYAKLAHQDGLYVSNRKERVKGMPTRVRHYVLVRVKRGGETIFESRETHYGANPFPSKLLITQLMLL